MRSNVIRIVISLAQDTPEIGRTAVDYAIFRSQIRHELRQRAAPLYVTCVQALWSFEVCACR